MAADSSTGTEAQDAEFAPDEGVEEGSPKASGSDRSQPQNEAKGKGPGPWAKDIEGIRDAEDPVQWIDDYLRSNWQPRLTQIEQEAAQYGKFFEGGAEDAEVASQILNALRENPEAAYQELGQLLGFNSEEGEYAPTEDGEYDEYSDEGESQSDDPRLSWIEEQMQAQVAAEEDAAYADLLQTIEGQVPGFNSDLFTHMVLATNGDLDAAWDAYMQFHNAPPPTEDAPPTLGTGPGGTAPPKAESFDSIEDAIKAFSAEDRARRG